MGLSEKDIYDEIIKRIVMKPYSIKTLETQIGLEFRQFTSELAEKHLRNALVKEPAFSYKLRDLENAEYVYDPAWKPETMFEVWTPQKSDKSTNIMLKALQEIQEFRETCGPIVKEIVGTVMKEFWNVSDTILKLQKIGENPELPTDLLEFRFIISGMDMWKIIILREVAQPLLRAEWEKFIFYCDTLRARN